MMTSLSQPVRPQLPTDEYTVLAHQLASIVSDRRQRAAVSGLLRALTRSLLDATATMRHEAIEPYEQTLAFAARRIVGDLGDEPVHADSRYVLGRLDALLDLCDMGIDRSVSDEVVALARDRAHVRRILEHLVHAGETRASGLADAVGIKRNYLSNILGWMESVDLIRRASAGRATLVSLGPKGEAVHLALIGKAEDTHARTPWIETELEGETDLPTGMDDTQVNPVAA